MDFPMMESIVGKTDVLAYVIRGSVIPDKTIFPTGPELELQVGYVVYPRGGAVLPHRHLPVIRRLSRTCEVVLVRQGRCEMDLYDDGRQVIATRELCAGDLVILVSGGHGFRMSEDTILLEIKQGPYYGVGEKERLA
jgi:hypothetical protein